VLHVLELRTWIAALEQLQCDHARHVSAFCSDDWALQVVFRRPPLYVPRETVTHAGGSGRPVAAINVSPTSALNDRFATERMSLRGRYRVETTFFPLRWRSYGCPNFSNRPKFGMKAIGAQLMAANLRDRARQLRIASLTILRLTIVFYQRIRITFIRSSRERLPSVDLERNPSDIPL